MITAKWKRYLIPGIAFQSVVIGGGYGTGREIVEFFLASGPLLGLASMAFTTLIFSLVCAVSYEFARQNGTYDYQSFFRALIGPLAPIYELAWYALMLIVLSVVTAAVGAIMRDVFGVPYWLGIAGLGVVTVGLVAFGTSAIKRVFGIWSVVLYGVFFLTLIWAFVGLGTEISEAFSSGGAGGATGGSRNWMTSGIAYAGYNVALIPALLYTVRDEVSNRREALLAGLLAGPIAMIPAAMFFVAMAGLYPEILPAAVPSNDLLEALGSSALQIGFQLVLVGTLIETSIGMIQSVNERLGLVRDRSSDAVHGSAGVDARSAMWPALLALGWMLVAGFFAQFGLIDLIARGYGTITWIFIGVYVVPVLTLGVWRIRRPVAE